MTVPQETQIDAIADALVEKGYVIMDNLLPEDLLTALIEHFNCLQKSEFASAGVGRKKDFAVQENIRSDKIHWLSPSTQATTDFLLWMDTLRIGLNRRLFLNLCDYESHFAYYPIGAFYKKHLDSFREQLSPQTKHHSNRTLSTVVYLNKNWQRDDGGELILYEQEGDSIIEKITPVLGRLVIFLSEKFPHEVLPAVCERKSIAGWFRVNH